MERHVHIHVYDAAFKETEHKRDDGGKFAESASNPAEHKKAAEYHAEKSKKLGGQYSEGSYHHNAAYRHNNAAQTSGPYFEGQSKLAREASVRAHAIENETPEQRETRYVNSAVQSFRDAVNEGDVSGTSVYDLVDFMKTNFRAEMPEREYEAFTAKVIAAYQKK